MNAIHIHLQSIPSYTPPDAILYLAGNFNNWDAGDSRYRLNRRLDGAYQLTFQTPLNFIEYKVTRGDWRAAEGDLLGDSIPNREMTASEPHDWIIVHSWTDMKEEALIHTNSENVTILDQEFDMPQLGRKRRIWAYLPPGYWAGKKRYPVLYMQDGQNLFDRESSFSGEWNVDEALNRMFIRSARNHTFSGHPLSGVIVIGIDNGGPHRVDEYSPWINPGKGGGEGHLYLRFLVETLKPFVDKHLRTLKGRESTGIMGSSLGGLFATYAFLERPDMFGMAGIFSPALWFAPQLQSFIGNHPPHYPVRVLMMAGQKEGAQVVGDLLDLFNALLEAGFDEKNLHYDLYSDGTHAEWFWSREFEHAFRWLFQMEDTPDVHADPALSSNVEIHFSYDALKKEVHVTLDSGVSDPLLQIRDLVHNKIHRYALISGAETVVSLEGINSSLLNARILSSGDLIFSKKII